jgi:hypothetical protein
MPIIRIDYDNSVLDNKEILDVSNAVRDIVSAITSIDDVFVYANSSEVKIKIAPIEIFVEMSAHKIPDPQALLSDIKDKLASWKKESGFAHPINLTVIPMNWNIEIGI